MEGDGTELKGILENIPRSIQREGRGTSGMERQEAKKQATVTGNSGTHLSAWLSHTQESDAQGPQRPAEVPVPAHQSPLWALQGRCQRSRAALMPLHRSLRPRLETDPAEAAWRQGSSSVPVWMLRVRLST